MHDAPVLHTTVYIVIALVLIGVVTYWILYTRGLKTRRATLNQTGRPPLGKEEGILAATQEKERTGRTGTIS